jgi:hypothetical protein
MDLEADFDSPVKYCVEVSMKRLIAIFSLGFLLLFIAPSCTKAPPANPTPAGSTTLPVGNQTATQPPVTQDKPGVGDAAPDLQLADMTGKAVSLTDYKGQIVWLNFWASW